MMRDERTLWIGGFHMAKRSDATRLFVEYVERMRPDPEVNCPHLCTRLRLDNAREWAADNNEFQRVTSRSATIRSNGRRSARQAHLAVWPTAARTGCRGVLLTRLWAGGALYQ